MSARARRLALIGDPVEHSLSPRMHAAGFAAVGVEAAYVLARVPGDAPGEVAETMRRFAETGGGNVTLPHKAAAAQALDEMTRAVADTGACNCFWRTEDGALAGDNTDVRAIVEVVGGFLGGRAPADVLVLGAGGAAAAVAVAAGRLGAGVVRVANRTPARASRLVDRLRDLNIPARTERWPAEGTCEVIVNATSLGLRAEDPPPASFHRITPLLVLDLVYEPPAAGGGDFGTRWTRAAAGRGIPAIGGLEILLRQGAACYPRWFGVEGPVDALRRGLHGVDRGSA